MQIGGILFDIIANIQIWLIVFLSTFTCILPYMIYRRWEILFYDDIINNLRHDKYEQDYNKKTYIKKIEAVSKYTRSIAKFRKIFNKDENFEPENLADKKIKAVVDGFRSSKKKSKMLEVNDFENVNLLNTNAHLNNINGNINENKARENNFRKYSTIDDHERPISLENNYNKVENFNKKKKNLNPSVSINNENSRLKNLSEKNNMNINIINNNIINSNNNNGNFDPNTYSTVRSGSLHLRQQNNQIIKNKSSSNTNIQNSSSNNYNYNYIHPYDEEDLINEHLGGKFKPVTTTTGRVLNPNDSYERDLKVVSRENTKFEFNINKFKNINNNLNNKDDLINQNQNNENGSKNLINNINRVNNLIRDEMNDERHLNEKQRYINDNDDQENLNMGDLEENDLIAHANLKKTTEFYKPNDDLNKKLVENEKNLSKSTSKFSESNKGTSKFIPFIKKLTNSN